MTYSQLFESAKLGKLELRNRTLVAPMTRVSASASGCVGPLMQPYYERFGKGGFGAIITEGVYTDQHFSQGYEFQPGITDKTQAASWAELIKGVKATGAKIIMQLMHAGALSQFNRFSNETRGPSPVQPKGHQMEFYRGSGMYPTPSEMTVSEIKTAICGFADSAKRAQEAGADGVEIHSANGYLLDQFLTDYANQRGDQYGQGIFERARLTCEVLEAVRDAVGGDFTVGVRLSQSKVNDFEHKWAGQEDDAKVIFEAVEASGADFVHTTEFAAQASAFQHGASLAAHAKNLTGLPVIANGGLGDPAIAQKMILQDECDFVAIGKDALVTQNWPVKVQKNEARRPFDFEMFTPLADLETANAYFSACAEI